MQSIEYGEMSELAEGARLEIVYAPKAYLGFESPSLRQNSLRRSQERRFFTLEVGWIALWNRAPMAFHVKHLSDPVEPVTMHYCAWQMPCNPAEGWQSG